MTNQPEQFSPWISWQAFQSIRLKENRFRQPGVYLLGNFVDAPSGNADPEDYNVVYIGETTQQSLKDRLYQFDRSAFQQKDGHSGGWTYNDLRRSNKIPPGDLFVSFLPIPNTFHRDASFFIKFIVRRSIWKYISKNNRPPLCNRE